MGAKERHKEFNEKLRRFLVDATNNCTLHNGWPCSTCLLDLCKQLGVPLTYKGERPRTSAIHFPALVDWISRLENEHENRTLG
jgi:hypothetical protein